MTNKRKREREREGGREGERERGGGERGINSLRISCVCEKKDVVQ